MKNLRLFFVLPFTAVIILLLTFCDKKKETVSPEEDFSPNSTTTSTVVVKSLLTSSTIPVTTAANPNINIVTITGTTSTSNPATQNSALNIGISIPGWSFDACSVNLNKLTGYNGNCKVELEFGGGSIASMSYAFTAGVPTAGQARMIVTNAPGQPTGVSWYSKNGIVSVVTGTSGTTANFSNIACLQQTFLFPVVMVSGNMVCN